MMDVEYANEAIFEFIPQRPPIVMIDKLFYCNETETKTALTIRENNIFVQNGKLQSTGLMENIAQTAAASAGYQFKKNNLPVAVGFIGAIKSFSVEQLPEVNSEITTTIQETQQVMNIKIIQGKIFQNDSLIASCEMKIFLQE